MKVKQKVALGGAVLGAMALGGAAGAMLITPASAQSSTSSTVAASNSSSTTAPANSPASFPAHGSAAHEDAEKSVTGSAATHAQAAAVKYVGSGTAGAVTTDFTGTGYEVTVTKSDGSHVEVHLDSSFNVGGGHFGGGGQPGG